MGNNILTNLFRSIGESYQFDIDMNGNVNKQEIFVKIDSFGSFVEANLNEKPISKKELYEIIGIESRAGIRLDYYLSEFNKINENYKVIYHEKTD